ncbi:hypothetical protein [Caballeronia sp. ATUFL_F1_KS4A]|uniref:hypothetical protein n=1 Tax=Caballeronia sp. ATUFL_F1_KS4A TaxID=2921768 RepID=UPI0020296C4F|nr:hypothetical protein [Caballeronia sp. ATUFL_F1_KS4A]
MHLIAVIFISGCANSYTEHYQSFVMPAATGIGQRGADIAVYVAGNLSERVDKLLAKGYVILGVSAFVNNDVGRNYQEAFEFGRQKDADIVVLWDAPVISGSLNVPSGLPPNFCKFASYPCGATTVPLPARAYFGIAMARASESER